jgi:hypothetical protein
VRCKFKGKTLKGKKYQHKHDFKKKEVSLAKLKVVWRGLFMRRMDNFFLQKGLNNFNTT